MSGTDKLAELYDNYNKLDAAKDNIGEFESSYLSILSAVKGTQPEKQLCSQFISKFFVHFPNHYDTAIDALLDLCEDDDTNIRRHAIKELPSICRERKEYVPKIADVLAQLLQTEDSAELNVVNHSLTTLAKYDAKGFFGGLFMQINSGDDIVREKAIKFFKDRWRLIPTDVLTKEVEEYFLDESRKVMADVSKEEFITFMTLLSGLKISKVLSGHQTLLDIVKEQAELNTPFDASEMDFVDKLIMSVRHGIPFFSQFVPSTEFVEYICVQVLPQLPILESKQPGIELDFLQLLAEMSPYVSPTIESIEVEKCLSRVFPKLLEYMPTPPPIDSETTVATNGSSTATTPDEPSLQFSHIECLLYTFQQLCKLFPQFLADAQSERVKDFKLRLQYVARGVQSYLTKLKKHLSTVKGEALKSDDNKLRVMALKTTNNINTLIRELFKIPPNYKSTINLSWKPPASKNAPVKPTLSSPITSVTAATTEVTAEPTTPVATTPGASKRKPITAPEGSSDSKRDRKIYAPPGGKFSGGVKRFPQNNNGNSYRGSFRGGNGRGRGGFRGRRGGSGGFKRGFKRF
ncbi:apoptosis inhibitor 5-like [Oppia nitens]|uniref:apoptosis inhibitor 5-like n=1 Tax=Oppia nitens TaxID=1686743 RepID=UPI0023DADD67|nr:apoptosis inhibitor 5-like [Oppia nitens]XP_054159480.1 apoptosis inhibitor 5-like [Oppia nitens]